MGEMVWLRMSPINGNDGPERIAGWTRGPKIPRQVNIGGVLHTVEFDPFTPKAIDLLGHNLPRATRTRCIELRMRPKLKTEKVEQFNQLDDAEFAVLRRKFARFAADNAAALKDAKPIIRGYLVQLGGLEPPTS